MIAVSRLLRSAHLLSAAGAFALAASGCTDGAHSDEPGAREPVEPRYGGDFHLMMEAPGVLDPSLVDDVYEACMVNQIYDGLLEYDVNLNPVPSVAREWSVSRDGTEYVFTLRDDVRFHNGRAVVAEDFVYSFSRIFAPGREDHGLGGEYLKKIKGVREYSRGEATFVSGLVAEGPHTLRIRLDSPYASFLSALAMDQTKVVAREEVERWGDDPILHACGTGPFILDEFLTDDPDNPRVVLRANPDHFRGRPYLDRLVFHTPGDFNLDRGAEALLAEEITICDMPGRLQDTIEGDSRFRIVRRPEISFSFIGMNVNDLPDARVRRAVAHAVDRDRILALDPVGRIPAEGILPPGMFGYSPDPKAVRYDLDAARRLLEEAGHPGGEGLPVLEFWQADRGEVGRQADVLMQEDLARVGIRIEYRYVDWDEFDKRLTAQDLPGFGLTWVGDVPDPDSFLASLFKTQGAYNLFSYSNAEVDSLLQAGSEMRSSAARAELYRRAERIILQDAPVIPLFHLANNFAVRAEVQGLSVTPFGLGNVALERVWIGAPPS
ncbi:MAG TPA: ABC transporter substrate-binding protein [bacterium]|nr:ABC transporter substrate-binding protein [bacterium]